MNEESSSSVAENTNEAIAAAPEAETASAPDGSPAAETLLSGAGATEDTGQPAEEKESGGEDGKEGAPEGAPEAYADFTAPEGLKLDQAAVEEFKGAARELNLSQDRAQAFLDRMAPVLARREMERVAEISRGWAERSQSDREIKAGLAGIREMRNRYAYNADGKLDPEIAEFIASPMGNHPGCLKFLARIGRNFTEAGFPQGSESRGTGKVSPDALYGKM